MRASAGVLGRWKANSVVRVVRGSRRAWIPRPKKMVANAVERRGRKRDWNDNLVGFDVDSNCVDAFEVGTRLSFALFRVYRPLAREI